MQRTVRPQWRCPSPAAFHDSPSCQRLLHSGRHSTNRGQRDSSRTTAPTANAGSARLVRPSSDLAARPSQESRLAQRDFFFDILNVNATRRDAKQYLSRFKQKPSSVEHADSGSGKQGVAATSKTPSTGRVRLQNLYGSTKAIRDSPKFRDSTEDLTDSASIPNRHLHVALVSIRAADKVDDASLDGIAITLSQLVRLDMRIVMTFDISISHATIPEYQVAIQAQARRIIRALDAHHGPGARYIDSCFGIRNTESSKAAPRDGLLTVENPEIILRPLKQTLIPVLPSLAFDSYCKANRVSYSDLLVALTQATGGKDIPTDSVETSLKGILLDRIIMIDPSGGIPSQQRDDRSHVFINMAEEFSDIAKELNTEAKKDSELARSHLTNLKTLHTCLGILPSTASALIISPEEAASSSRPAPERDSDGPTIRTRRQKNPLIHNLLTNRPVISSTLPMARVAFDTAASSSHSTLVKWGMPLSVVPTARSGPWQPPSSGLSPIDLCHNSSIDLPRLQHLVDDSFRRKLDVEAYLERVRGRVAGVLVAGNYEGGAILTWEVPPGASDQPSRFVPYLDKFAVLQKSQGNAGVADIVFQAMTRSCLPRGVCWRSRSNNPVNKWYFERSVGTWKLPGGQWTMFWTTPNEDLVLDKQKWHDYVAVCSGVVPTWLDGDQAKPD